ncbi:amidohydrolase family protein [Alteromonas sp. CYL-A6]|uniref:amidohydrolase family protein n=1 Tax=Alteromonas nitratireducens TaxID=3390813 RepID=UPI0034BD86DD
MRVVDPHLHFFFPSEGRYDWLRPENPPFWPDKPAIAAETTERDLPRHGPVTVAGFVHIEAGFDNDAPWREIHRLQAHCRLPFRSIAGVSLTSARFFQQLDAVAALLSVVGVRDILDGQATALLIQPAVRYRLGQLAARNLMFEAQLSLSDSVAVKKLCDLLTRYPTLKITLNHAGMPDETEAGFRRWQQSLRLLAAFPTVAIKISGLEMQHRRWSTAHLKRIIEPVLATFDDTRIMFASNAPLCRWRGSYTSLWQTFASMDTGDKADALLCHNAAAWYNIPVLSG